MRASNVLLLATSLGCATPAAKPAEPPAKTPSTSVPAPVTPGGPFDFHARDPRPDAGEANPALRPGDSPGFFEQH